ncbi:MAG: phosphoserine phosphatase [Labilithrix sp.]|nr:phosphoserine phosphatase [Labilithrix sp.]
MVWASEIEAPRVSVAWLSRPRVGEIVSGDAVVVRQIGDAVLVAVIDALGHGPKAAEVADRSSEFFESVELTDGAPSLVRGLHERLQGSRGAAALIVVVSRTGVEACSVGNVELRSASGTLPFVLTPGVLGLRLRHPKICSSPGYLADRLVLYSDGISGRFDLKTLRAHAPPELASHIFASHRHEHDDATVVVVDVA